jgi:hypothetical protein
LAKGKKSQRRPDLNDIRFLFFLSMAPANKNKRASKERVSDAEMSDANVDDTDAQISGAESDVSVDEDVTESLPMNASANPASSALLQHFWDLASLESAKRQETTVALLDQLKSAQQAHFDALGDDVLAKLGLSGKDLDGDSSGKKSCIVLATEADLKLVCASDVLYALRRLIRGLSSARQGEIVVASTVLTTQAHDKDSLWR